MDASVAQAIGNAFYERLAYDKNRQLLNGAFMDYHLPTSLDVPHIDAVNGVTHSPRNPMGVKGAGEAGAIPVDPPSAQALEGALYDVDFEILEIGKKVTVTLKVTVTSMPASFQADG